MATLILMHTILVHPTPTRLRPTHGIFTILASTLVAHGIYLNISWPVFPNFQRDNGFLFSLSFLIRSLKLIKVENNETKRLKACYL
jgi:hypothetical protein